MHMFKLTATAALLAALAISLACPAANAQALGSNNPGDTTTISSTGTTTNGVSNATSSYNGNDPYDGYDNFGTLTVTGGTFNHDYDGLANYGTATISGGTFESDNTGVTSNGVQGPGTVVTITGGTFGANNTDITAINGGVIDIYGTAFSNITGTSFTSGFGKISSGFASGSFDWTANGQTQTLTYLIGESAINLIQTPSGVAATPEPSAWLVLGLGALGLGALTLRARKARGAA